MNDRYDIRAVVVTYNRKELLQECLEAILSQSYPVREVIVINNHSTDGTEKLFLEEGPFYSDQIKLITTEKNLGGAGGFSFGIRKAAEQECDFIWIMDDDTIPETDSLQELVRGYGILEKESPGYLASAVFGVNGEPMNVPVISRKTAENGYADWYRYLYAGAVKIRHATFVSLLFPREAVLRVGYPISDYFLWGDDTEYTQRLGRHYGEGYFIGSSKVIHKRFNARSVSILEEENETRVRLYRYYYRNSLITAKEYNPPGNSALHVCEFVLVSLKCLLKSGVKYRWLKFCTVQKGIWEYLLSSGRYRKQISTELKENSKI
ncbi:MAG: glycosyltransferase family 2 protein [Solobacterium sp.]|nr:glycosyltransferase family 2 protein [Solobacterium sp.]